MRTSIDIRKRGEILHKVLIHIILVGILFALFVGVMGAKIGNRGIKQQVLEKQTALLIDAASEGSSFEIRKKNLSGFVDDVRVEDGRIFVGVDGLRSVKGYPYFSRYSVDVEEDETKFVVKVG